MQRSTLPDAIARGIKSLEPIEACEVVGAPEHDIVGSRWALEVTLRIGTPGPFVGAKTNWFALLDENYPFGEMGLYPAAKGSISATFQHQARNSTSRPSQKWRNGKLCLDAKFRRSSPESSELDPIGDDELRLRWYIERAIKWLTAAARGELAAKGDPFELPERARTSQKPWKDFRVVHDESAASLSTWRGRYGHAGRVDFGALAGVPFTLGAAEFAASDGATIKRWEGRKVETSPELPEGIWWLWPTPALLPPWQVPRTWGDLRRAGRAAKVDLDALLRRIVSRLRGRERRAVLLVGYPIPQRIGADPVEICWDALVLPKIPPASVPSKAFRANAFGWWQRDRSESFGDSTQLEWLGAENWSSARLNARGRLSKNLRSARIAIVGLGALGSRIAEHLTRAGTGALTLIDAQILTAGNICRHTATLADVEAYKVDAVKKRLLQISPTVTIETFDFNLSGGTELVSEMLASIDVVVDCTASNAALSSLATGWWSTPKAFASYSLGDRGRRLYSFGVIANGFPQAVFDAAVAPWLPSSLESSTTSKL